MLPYDGSEKLESLLESLYADEESALEDIVILVGPVPLILFEGNCCNYNYGSYGG